MVRTALVLDLLVLLLVPVAAGCGGGSSTADAKTDPAVCKMQLEAAIDRTCSVPGDCVLVDSADCCGTIKLAVKAGTQAAFTEAERTYVACLACPPLGCQHADQAEDGMTPQAGQSIVATCVQSRCKSIVQ
jgi:hypothetical protein